MRFETNFQVPGTPAGVLERFADVPAMASLLPGASVGEQAADGSYPSALVVAFGPKRITFNGVITNEVDRANSSGLLKGRAAANMRAAKMAVSMTYTLRAIEGTATPTTRVELVSEAELTGILADFAETGGRVVTEAMLKEFAQNFAAQSQAGSGESGQSAAPAAAISGTRLAEQALKSMLSPKDKSSQDKS